MQIEPNSNPASLDTFSFVAGPGSEPPPASAASFAGPASDNPLEGPTEPPAQTEPEPPPTDVWQSELRSMVWDVPFDCLTMGEAIDRIEAMIVARKPSYVVTANLNYVMLHHRQRDVPTITRDADLILADGQPIVWRSKLGRNPLPERIAGSEMIYELAHRAAQLGWRIYFLGGAPDVASVCATRLANSFPGLQVAGVESPPFRELTEAERAQQQQRIQQSRADILLVAFGQPKGERWIHQNYRQLGVPVSIQLGASFDFVAGTARRASPLIQRLGMEWCYRMLRDPRRLVPRYAANAAFLAGALMEDWKRKVTSWGMGQWTDHVESASSPDGRLTDGPAGREHA